MGISLDDLEVGGGGLLWSIAAEEWHEMVFDLRTLEQTPFPGGPSWKKKTVCDVSFEARMYEAEEIPFWCLKSFKVEAQKIVKKTGDLTMVKLQFYRNPKQVEGKEINEGWFR